MTYYLIVIINADNKISDGIGERTSSLSGEDSYKLQQSIYIMENHLQQKYSQAEIVPTLTLAVESYNALILKQDNFKVDLESQEGIEAFKTYTSKIQQLIKICNVSTQPRDFRDAYTNAYQVLYMDGQLGYIPQIFDAAQEAFPYIWVNGECYLFEPSTVSKGEKLVDIYFRLIQLIRLIYLHSYDRKREIPPAYSLQLRERLAEFDNVWITYERSYIDQLIKIEEQAKRNLIDTVLVEKKLVDYQNEQKIKGKIFYQNSPEYHSLRRSLCEKVGKLNSVANLSGKGRDDLSYEILLAAENVLTKISDSQSKSIRMVAEKIRQSFVRLREVLRTFDKNIEMVDPQLKNNEPLVIALEEYESSWEKGKRYFLEEEKECQIITFSTILEAAKQKYAQFKNQLQFSDPCVFWMIPSIVVLNSLEGDDEGLAESYISQMKSNHKLSQQYTALKIEYEEWKLNQKATKKREIYNRLERNLILENGEGAYYEIVSKIKQFAISLERHNPTDWNDMLSVLLTDDA